ncbi:MAG: VOC family protein [candidate division KSB1 bacterium]
MSATRFGLNALGQIAVIVRDLEQAVAFYREVLGMQFLFQAPNLAFFNCNGIRLMLGPAETPEFDHPSSILYFKVDDLHAAYTTLSARGVQFRDKPHLVAKLPDHELWMTFFEDLDKNILALMSEVR